MGGDASPHQKQLQAQLLADQQREEDNNTLGVWVLTQEEEEKCRELFNALDKDRKGNLDLKKVKVLLHTLGHNVSSEKVTVLVRGKQFVKGCIVGVSEHGTD